MYDRTIVETVEYHHTMLRDETRMQSYLRAILRTVEPGDVVLDIGSGTGVLAYFACMAGAKRVYAVEQDPVVELARAICNHNSFQDRVVFLNEWSDQVELPERADVLVTETIGNIGFEEGILGWIIDAKERLLVPGGRIIPASVELVVAPIEIPDGYDFIDDWAKEIFTLDLTPARAVAANNLLWINLQPKMFLNQPTIMIRTDLANVESTNIAGESVFVAERDGAVQGLGCWFKAELVPGISISNGPEMGASSWTQILLPLEHPVAVSSGDQLQVQIQASANGAQWDWRVSNEDKASSRCVQTTHSGQLLQQANQSDLNRKPVRNMNGEVDRFILQMMDGSTTVEEIIRRTMARFPLQFRSFEDTLLQVQQVANYYSHSANGQSPINGSVSEEMLQEPKTKMKEV
jgi:precorrin-6B methylase 2